MFWPMFLFAALAYSADRAEVDGLDVWIEEGQSPVIRGVLSGHGSYETTSGGTHIVLTESTLVIASDTVLLEVDRGNEFLNQALPQLEWKTDRTGIALLREYGAIYLSRGVTPPTVRFTNKADVEAFQQILPTESVVLVERELVLQRRAARALQLAHNELAKQEIILLAKSRRPAGRSYFDTVINWDSRMAPGIEHWRSEGRLEDSDAGRILQLADGPQIDAILRMEERGLWCNRSHTRSILTSVAAPGSSQHNSLLAIDVLPVNSPVVTDVMAKHGWYRTVKADQPHFTWLGLPEEELSQLGLKKVNIGGLHYWVPDF
jgi:hypothetical protein